MKTLRSPAVLPRIEPLEPRLLLSAESPWPFALGDTPVTAELESQHGPSNDSLATAQLLEFTPLTPAYSGPQQVVVSGHADGTGSTGYEYGEMIFAAIAYPNSYPLSCPHVPAPGGGGLLTVTARADLGGLDKFLSLEAEGIFLGDLFVTDGLTGTTVSTTVALSQAQLATLAADGVIDFTFTPSPAVMRAGTGFLSIDLSFPGSLGGSDFYCIDLSANESIAIYAAASDPSLSMQLLSADGVVLADAQPAGNFLTIPTYLTSDDGSFYIRISGSGEYTFAVNRNFTQNLQPAPTLLDSAPVDGYQYASGRLAEGQTDLFAVELAPGSLLKIRVMALDSSAELFVNVYDASGTLLAAGSTIEQAASRLSEGGLYFIEVSSTAADVDYLLRLESSIPGDNADKPDKPNAPGQAKKASAQNGNASPNKK